MDKMAENEVTVVPTAEDGENTFVLDQIKIGQIDRANLHNIANNFDKIEEKIGEVDSDITNIKNQIGEITDETISKLQEDVSKNAKNISTNAGNIQSLSDAANEYMSATNETLTDHEARISQNTQGLNTINNTTLPTLKENLEGEIEKVSTDLTNLKNGSSSTIKTLDEGIAANSKAIQDLIGGEGSSGDTISGISSRLSQAEEDIDNIEQEVNTNVIKVTPTPVNGNTPTQYINSPVIINGDFKVTGTTTSVDTDTLKVKDNLIVANSTGASLTKPSGLAIATGTASGTSYPSAYGIVYDPSTETVKLGKGTLDSNYADFVFNQNEGKPIALRADSTTFREGNIIKWDSTNNIFVDGGIAYNQIVVKNELNAYGKLATDNTWSGKNIFANIEPSSNNTYDLGTSSTYWKAIYANTIKANTLSSLAGGNLTIPNVNGTIATTNNINSALTSYVTLATKQTISGKKQYTQPIDIQGQIVSSSDNLTISEFAKVQEYNTFYEIRNEQTDESIINVQLADLGMGAGSSLVYDESNNTVTVNNGQVLEFYPLKGKFNSVEITILHNSGEEYPFNTDGWEVTADDLETSSLISYYNGETDIPKILAQEGKNVTILNITVSQSEQTYTSYGNTEITRNNLSIKLPSASGTLALTKDITNELKPYAKTSDLSAYAKTTDLSAYAKTTDLDKYALTSTLSAYGTLAGNNTWTGTNTWTGATTFNGINATKVESKNLYEDGIDIRNIYGSLVDINHWTKTNTFDDLVAKGTTEVNNNISYTNAQITIGNYVLKAHSITNTGAITIYLPSGTTSGTLALQSELNAFAKLTLGANTSQTFSGGDGSKNIFTTPVEFTNIVNSTSTITAKELHAESDVDTTTFTSYGDGQIVKKYSNGTTTSQYIYTLPSKSGTLATTDDVSSIDLSAYGKLNYSNTWSGTNNFDSNVEFRSTNAPLSHYGFNATNGTTTSQSTKYQYGKITNGSYTLTLPSKTGTLATLDDVNAIDLSGYGKLSGTNSWTGTNIFNDKTTFTSKIQIDGLPILGFTSASIKLGNHTILSNILMASTATVTLPNTSGTLALTSAIKNNVNSTWTDISATSTTGWKSTTISMNGISYYALEFDATTTGIEVYIEDTETGYWAKVTSQPLYDATNNKFYIAIGEQKVNCKVRSFTLA